MSPARRSPWRVLRNPNFARLWLGQTISFIGDYFYFLAIPILVERLTGSALMVGLSVISSAVPMLLLGPIAGVFVDRWNRQRTMIIADVLRGLLVLLCLLVQTREQVWLFYGVGFLMSCVSRFFFPSQNALLPRIIGDPDDLLAANGLMQASGMVTLVIGPALAGFTIGLWGAPVAFLVDSLSFFVSAIFISTMVTAPRPIDLPRDERKREMAAVWRELQAGIAYLFSNRTMVGVLSMLCVVQLGVGAINVAFVPYLQRVFGVGPQQLGVVDSAQGIGMVIGGLALGLLAARLRRPVLIGVSLALIGLFCAGMGLAPTFAVVVACSFALGLALTPAQSALITLIQLAVPNEKQGRVGGATNSLATAAGLLSMAAAATLGETIGLRTVYVVCGAIVALSALIALRIPEPPSATPAERPTLQGEPPAPPQRAQVAEKTAPETTRLEIGGVM